MQATRSVIVESPKYVPGEWYVVVKCHHCQARHPLFHDLTCGKAKLKATYRWTCPDCKQKGDYDADELHYVKLYENSEFKDAVMTVVRSRLIPWIETRHKVLSLVWLPRPEDMTKVPLFRTG